MKAPQTLFFFILLLLPLLVVSSKEPVTLPLHHSESNAEEERKIKE